MANEVNKAPTRTTADLLDEIRLKRELREEAEYNAKEEEKHRLRDQQAAAIKADKERREEFQKLCNHMKPGGRTANVMGQRDHRGNLLLVCQTCFGAFNQKTLPPQVANGINWDHVGGPA